MWMKEGIKLNRSLKTPRLVNIGQICERKNQKELVDAISVLKNRGVKVDALLIGPPAQPYTQQLRQLIAEHKLQSQVKLYGYRDNPYELVGPNDIYVHTSQSESVGRSVVEAIKLGLVCVGSDNPGGTEVRQLTKVDLYKGGDIEALANLLEKIIANPKDYRSKAKVSQSLALKSLSLKSCHDPFFKALNKVFDQANPRKELSSMLSEFEAVDYHNRQQLKEIARLKSSIRQLDAHLNNILDSKSWQGILRLRKLLKR